MANAAHLSVVRDGGRAIESWRKASLGQRLDLSGADLYEADLQDADLSRADLTDAILERAHLFRANLSNATMLRANLRAADLRSADLRGADLTGADLSGARMDDARTGPPPDGPDAETFDVFLAHNSADKPLVELLSERLRQKGVRPWLDVDQIPPGRWFQDVLQGAVRRVRSAAIFLGTSGVGRWQALELRAFVSQCIESDRPIIPVLLPGVAEVDRELPFLRELHCVKFETLDDDIALEQLVWGIRDASPLNKAEQFVKMPDDDSSADSLKRPSFATGGTTRQTEVFIAYSPKDRAFARAVAETLRRAKIDVWLDVDDIAPGEYEDDARAAGFESANICLALVGVDGTPWQSLPISEMIRAECRRSVDKWGTGALKVIVPAYLPRAAISRLPPHLRSLRGVDLSQGFAELLTVVVGKRAARKIPWRLTAIASSILTVLLGLWGVSNRMMYSDLSTDHAEVTKQAYGLVRANRELRAENAALSAQLNTPIPAPTEPPPTRTFEDELPCDTLLEGNNLPSQARIELKRTAGVVLLEFETYNVEDEITVRYEGRVLYDSGCVATENDGKSQWIKFSGDSSTVTVTVSPGCAGRSGTSWNYRVHCPRAK